MNNILIKFASLWVFFPYVGFFPGVDVQPLFVLMLAGSLFVHSKHIKFSSFFLSGMILLVCLVFVYSAKFQDEVFFVKEIFFVVSFLLIHVSVKNGLLKINSRLLYIVLFVYTLVAAIQIFIPDFLSFLVSRSEEQIQMAVDSGRGVRSLTGEPSHLGKLYIVINVFLLATLRNEIGSDKLFFSKSIIVSVIILLLSMVFSRSFYMLSIHVFILGAFVLVCRTRFFFQALFLFSVSGVIFYTIVDGQGRVFDLLNIIFENPSLLLQQGAFRRLVNIPIIFNNLLIIGPFGVDDLTYSTMSVLNTPIGGYLYTTRATNLGGGFELLTKYGVVMLPLLSYFIFLLVKIIVLFNSMGYKMLGVLLSVATFVLFFQDGSISNPITLFLIIWLSSCSLSER